ncbi:hypothetical protein CVT26_015014, partial [Gymnopilus dilepis]
STCPLCSSLSLLTPLYFVDQRKAPKKQAAKLSWGGDDDDESEADSDDDDDDLNEGGMSEKQVSRVLQEEVTHLKIQPGFLTMMTVLRWRA